MVVKRRSVKWKEVSHPTQVRVGTRKGFQWGVKVKPKGPKSKPVLIHSPDKVTLKSFLKNHGYKFKKR